MARDFFQEHGELPSLVRLVFDAVDQDEMDRHEATSVARRGFAARAKRRSDRPSSADKTDSNRPPLLSTIDLKSVGGRALVTGAGAGVVGFVGIARFGVPFQASLALGIIAVAAAVVSVPVVPAVRHRLALRRASRQFEVCVSPNDLVVRSGKTVLRQWNLAAVSAVRVERRRLVVDGTDGASRILPIRFVKEEDVSGIVTRTRTLIEEARALNKKAPSSKR